MKYVKNFNGGIILVEYIFAYYHIEVRFESGFKLETNIMMEDINQAKQYAFALVKQHIQEMEVLSGQDLS
jgi:hypothetical protein